MKYKCECDKIFDTWEELCVHSPIHGKMYGLRWKIVED